MYYFQDPVHYPTLETLSLEPDIPQTCTDAPKLRNDVLNNLVSSPGPNSIPVRSCTSHSVLPRDPVHGPTLTTRSPDADVLQSRIVVPKLRIDALSNMIPPTLSNSSSFRSCACHRWLPLDPVHHPTVTTRSPEPQHPQT